MKKGEFKLEGFAVDCRQLPEMGDAGKEIFRALKVACNGQIKEGLADYDFLRNDHSALVKNEEGDIQFFTDYELEVFDNNLIQPSDVLGQARIDAAKDGATMVFDGDAIPDGAKTLYYGTGEVLRNDSINEIVVNINIIAYKLIDEKQPSIESRILAEKVGAKHDAGKPLYNLIPVHAEAELVDVLTFGATKYAPNQWRNVENATERYTAAAMRHLAAYRMGETHDTESGKHHLAHAMCCLAFIIEMNLEQNK